MGGADGRLDLLEGLLAAVGVVHPPAEVTPRPCDRILQWEAPFGGDAEQGEVNLARERAGIERTRVAADAEEVLVRGPVALDPAAALDAFERGKSLGV